MCAVCPALDLAWCSAKLVLHLNRRPGRRVNRRHRDRPVGWAAAAAWGAGVEGEGVPEMMSAESDGAARRWAAQGRRKWRRQVDQTRTTACMKLVSTVIMSMFHFISLNALRSFSSPSRRVDTLNVSARGALQTHGRRLATDRPTFNVETEPQHGRHDEIRRSDRNACPRCCAERASGQQNGRAVDKHREGQDDLQIRWGVRRLRRASPLPVPIPWCLAKHPVFPALPAPLTDGPFVTRPRPTCLNRARTDSGRDCPRRRG